MMLPRSVRALRRAAARALPLSLAVLAPACAQGPRSAMPEGLRPAAAAVAASASRPSSATRSVFIVSDSFPVPQLGRTRRVWLYLPPGYATSGRRYPVLYLQDGQNVFDAATSYAGEWGVDEALDTLAARGAGGLIVVAVDNAGARRLDEYSPWRNARFGGGEGAAYVQFLVQDLKPYVDAHYRTRRDAAHTGIGGSSMGGLISLYAALQYPGVFGRALVFSPSLWFAPEIFTLARQAQPRRSASRFYFVTGGLEGEPKDAGAAARDQQRMADTLAAAGFDARSLKAVIAPDGKHSEWFWRREFPAAYLWLFGSR